MSQITLYGKKRYFITADYRWMRVLQLAVLHGWLPKGTKPTSTTKRFIKNWKNWDEVYYTRYEFQLVDDEDAKNLAKALSQAIRVLPDTSVSQKEGGLTSYWSGIPNKLFVWDLMKFCEKGRFVLA